MIENSRKYKNYIGQTFNRLKILDLYYEQVGKSKIAFFTCVCSCAEKTIKSIRAASVVREHAKSCGCYDKERRKTHGMSGTPIYQCYLDIFQRCYNENAANFNKYGAKGRKVCECISSFEVWFEHVSKLENYGEKGYTIDRIDNYGIYCICTNNLRWATKEEQTLNRGIQSNNKTGFVGVHYDKSRNKYVACLGQGGKTVFRKRCDTLDEAIEARKQAEIKFRGKVA